MRNETKVFLALVPFFIVVGTAYAFFTARLSSKKATSSESCAIVQGSAGIAELPCPLWS